MIPYIELRAIEIGSLRIPTFGALMTAGVIVGHLLMVRRARALGVASPHAAEAFTMAVVGTAVVASFVVTGGASSIAAFAGAAAATVVVSRVVRVPVTTLLDLAAYAFPPGWLVARLGCALVHDHPGAASDSPLAVAFPDGPRYDLGVLELFAMIPLAILALALGGAWRRAPRGRLAAAVGGGYAAIRFAVELARDRAPGAFPLSAAQIACLFTIGLAALLALRPAREQREREADR